MIEKKNPFPNLARFRFLDIQYNRNDNYRIVVRPSGQVTTNGSASNGETSTNSDANNGVSGEPQQYLSFNDDRHIENTVIFLPNVWTLMPTSVEYDKIAEAYKSFIDKPPIVSTTSSTATTTTTTQESNSKQIKTTSNDTKSNIVIQTDTKQPDQQHQKTTTTSATTATVPKVEPTVVKTGAADSSANHQQVKASSVVGGENGDKVAITVPTNQTTNDLKSIKALLNIL